MDIRCKACNVILLAEYGPRKPTYDDEYCSECKYHSTKDYCASDKSYDHEAITGIHLDGSTLSLDASFDDSE